MAYADSEITRLFAELFVNPSDRYRIREEIAWIVQYSSELDDTSRKFYRDLFGLKEGTTAIEAVQ